MKRMLHVVAVALAGLMLASFISACGGAGDMDAQKGMRGPSDFYQDGYEPGSGYPYTKPNK
ncbi:MAG: hypothetical protein ACREV4_07560 [Gammaproteobacteria bacterium]